VTPLLKFLVRYCQRLFDVHRFEIVDSKNTPVESEVYLKNSDVTLRLLHRHPAQPELFFQAAYEKQSRTWHSLQEVSHLLGRPTAEKALDEANTAFLLTHTDMILRLFSKEKTPATLETLRRSQKSASKNTFQKHLPKTPPQSLH